MISNFENKQLEEAVMSDRIPESSEGFSGHQTKLVLLIDDDASIRYVLQEVLRHHGYQADTAATVEEAETIKQRLGAEALGVVIVDVHLTPNPRFHEGYQLYEKWITLHPMLPFLLISGIATSQHLPAIRAGDAPLLAKPFTMEALLAWVQQLLVDPNTPHGTAVE